MADAQARADLRGCGSSPPTVASSASKSSGARAAAGARSSGVGPLLARAVGGELDAVAVGVGQVDRLVRAVVGGALDRRARGGQPQRGAGQLLAASGRAGRSGRGRRGGRPGAPARPRAGRRRSSPPSPSAATPASWRCTRRPSAAWYQATERSRSVTVRWTAPRRSVAGSVDGSSAAAGRGVGRGHALQVSRACRPAAGWAGPRDPWTSRALAIGLGRAPGDALERAREVQLVAVAGPVGDLADGEVGEAQQPRRLEHARSVISSLVAAAGHLGQRARQRGRRARASASA